MVNGGGVTVNSIIYTDPTHITLNVTAAGNASGGARTITVTNPDGQSVTSSGILTVNTSAGTQLTIQTQPSSTATAGVPFDVQPVIRVEDSFGNLQTNDNSTVVSASRLAGAGTLQGSTSLSAVGGLVTFTNLSHRYATNITITFTSGSLSAATSSVVAVSSAAFSQVQILVPGQTATPTVSPGRTGTPLAHVSGTSFNVTVNAVDAFWNFVNNVTDNVGLSSSDGIAILPPNTALASGTATLNVTLKTVGTQNLAASDNSQSGIGIDVGPGMSITPATLTVVASNNSRVYGQTNPIFGGTLTGVESGDNITATFNSSATTNSAKGNYSIVPSLNDPNNRLGNYTVLSTNGILTVTAAPLSVTASNASRQYGLTNPVFSGTLTGLRNNDNITAAFVCAATTNSIVGTYNITPTLSDPTSKLPNYTVTTNNGTLTVTTAPVSITANDASRAWGATNPVFTGTIIGLQNNDNVTANYSTTATTNSAVGTYPITFSLSDPNSKLPNYVVTTNNGTLTVFNNSPTVTPIADQVTSVGATVSLTVFATDPDQASQTLSYSLDPGAPAGAAIVSSSGAFTWTVPVGAQGTTNPVTVRVSDNAVPPQSATTAFNIIVIDRPTLVDMQSNPDSSVSLTWNVVPGATYTLQSKNALTDATWNDLTQITPSGSTVTVSDNPAGSQRFYRLADGSAVSDPAGVMPVVFLGVSDSYVSIPFTRPITSSGAIASVASNIVTVSGVNWSPGQFAYAAGVQSNTYYARFNSGALEGRVYNVITNDSNTLTVDLVADTLDAVAAGDVISVIPHWTLNSAFPNGNGVLASPAQGNRYTELLFPDGAGTGINLSATKVYYFNGGIWKQVGQGSVNRGDDVLPLNSYFVVRQNVPTNSTMNSIGAVVVSRLALSLRAQAATEQDNSVGLIRASAVTLNNSGLISSGAFAASPLPGTRTDELLTFDNTVAQKNKSSSAVYYYWNSGWRRVGSGSADFGAAQVFTPGAGFIIRKATNATSVVWTNAP
ncbi:MAG: TIGR02597 family protein [Limisphaerales bacterium]